MHGGLIWRGGWLPILAVASVALALFASPFVATGIDEESERYEGRYRLAVTHQAAKQVIERAIVKGTEDMGPLRRAIGRKRLRAKNEVVREIRIGLPDERIRIELDQDRYVAPATGAWTRVRLDDGEVVRVSHAVQRGQIVQVFAGDDGQRRDEYILLPGGDRLQMVVTLTSPKLSAPIRYRLPYRRL